MSDLRLLLMYIKVHNGSRTIFLPCKKEDKMKEIRQKVAQILGLPQEQVGTYLLYLLTYCSAIATNPTKWEKEEEGKTFFSDETTLEEAKVTNGQPMLFGIKNLGIYANALSTYILVLFTNKFLLVFSTVFFLFIVNFIYDILHYLMTNIHIFRKECIRSYNKVISVQCNSTRRRNCRTKIKQLFLFHQYFKSALHGTPWPSG